MAITRRQLFPFAFGLVAVPAVAVAARPERAFSAVQPMCPDCGRFVMFLRRAERIDEDVPVQCGACGWRGVSPVAHRIGS